jgi:hypothetical protein
MGKQPLEVPYVSDDPRFEFLNLALRMAGILTKGMAKRIPGYRLGFRYTYPLPPESNVRLRIADNPELQGMPRAFPFYPDSPTPDAEYAATLSFDQALDRLGKGLRLPLVKCKRKTRDKNLVATSSLPSALDLYERLRLRRLVTLEVYQDDKKLQGTLRFNELLRIGRLESGLGYKADTGFGIDSFIANMIALDALLIHTAVRHQLPATRDPGLVYGFAREIVILEQRVPSNAWSRAARDFVEEAIALALSVSPTMAPLALGGATSGVERNKAEEPKSAWTPYDDWTRLLFYMKILGYREIRGGREFWPDERSAADTYEYVAIVLWLGENKPYVVVLDTVEVGHAALLLRGDNLYQLLALCQQDRTVLQASPLFKRRFVHNGDWTPRLRDILRSLLSGEA